MNSSLNLDTFLFHLKLFTTSFWNITHPYKSFASNYMRYDDSMFLLKFFVYLLFAFEYLCIVWHISPLTHFSTIINISLFVNNSNFIPVFFKQAIKMSNYSVSLSVIISMLLLFLHIVRISSESLEDMKLIIIINWLFHSVWVL